MKRFLTACSEKSIASRLGGWIVLSMIAGCGGDMATVNGVVSLDGTPIAGGLEISGTVRFYPENGGGAPAIGRIDESGKYELRTGGQTGVAPGAYRVGIAVKKIGPPDVPGGMPRADLITPPRYASITKSGLRKVVEPGNNSIDFGLSSN
jgi:hypothetical protein